MSVSASLPHWHPTSVQGISDPKMSLHPEVAKLSASVEEGFDLIVLVQSMALRITGFITPKHAHLPWPQSVKEKWRMGGHKDLRCVCCVSAFFPQPI